MTPSITVDRFQAIEVYDKLVDQYLRKDFPYNQPEVICPQVIRPKNIEEGTREHALFLLCSCYYMRGGIESDTAFYALRRMYEAEPELFNPEYVVSNKIDPEVISSTLSSFQLGYNSGVNGKFWVGNFRHLHEHWDGDPRKLFVGTTSYDELCRHILNKQNGKRERMGKYAGLMGFQHKMVSMLTYFLTECNLVQFPYVYPIPVDFHVLRVNLEHGIVDISRARKNITRSDRLLQTVRDLTVWYCHLREIPSNILCDCLWLLSKYVCRHHPGNMATVRDNPRYAKEGKPYRGRKRRVTRRNFYWTKARIQTYQRTCGNCPVEKTCEYLVPSADYYVKGRVRIDGLRTKPPQLTLFEVQRENIWNRDTPRPKVIPLRPMYTDEEQLPLLRIHRTRRK